MKQIGTENKWRIDVFTILVFTTYLAVMYLGAPSSFFLILPLFAIHIGVAYYMTIINPTMFFTLYFIPSTCIITIGYLAQLESKFLAVMVFVCFFLGLLKIFPLRFNPDEVPAKYSFSYFAVSLLIPSNTALDKKFNNPPEISFQSLKTKFARVVGKIVLLLSTVGLARLIVHPYVSYYCAIWYAYVSFSGACDILAIIIESIALIPVHPVVNAPFFATSPRDFWSRRWNLIVRNFFHDFFFIPLVNSKLFSRSSAASISAILVFIFSGVTHEVFVWAVTGTWEWLGYMSGFFIIHGVACFAQAYVPQTKLPWVVSVLLVHVFMLLTAPLFFLPLAVLFTPMGFKFHQ